MFSRFFFVVMITTIQVLYIKHATKITKQKNDKETHNKTGLYRRRQKPSPKNIRNKIRKAGVQNHMKKERNNPQMQKRGSKKVRPRSRRIRCFQIQFRKHCYKEREKRARFFI